MKINKIKNLYIIPLNFCRNPIYSLKILRILLLKKFLLDDLRHYLRLNNRAYSMRFKFGQRTRLFIEHHRLIASTLGKSFLDSSRLGSMTLWREEFSSHVLAIQLTTPKGLHRYEGEMIVALECDGLRLMVMSFQVCNGESLGATGQVAFVSRIQGAPGYFDHIRQACKLMSDMNLSYALLSALEGFCTSLKIGQIVGIDCTAQTAFLGNADSPNFFNTYDKFWQKNHARLLPAGYYLLTLPLLPPDLPVPTGSHRARTLKHREIRRRITAVARQSLDDFRASRVHG